ncbi:MAG: L-threonylcarbamoyladenylate synthase [Candidatus Diapherotrites archaeon]
MTIILRIEDIGGAKAVSLAVKELKAGKVIIYPTETSYGIGASIKERDAVEKIKDIKSRRNGKPFLMHVSGREMAGKYAVLDEDADRLVKRFNHGRLSIVVKRKETVPEWVSNNGIGFRIANNKIANALCAGLGEPIITTSANLYGYDPCYSGEHAIEVFNGIADVILDAGDLPERPTTTIFDVKNRKILRQGEVTLAEIMRVLGEGKK